ncbi:MAG: penicillin-binding transpeptidase domain-containing protein, partial [Acidimicrobiales bacterium]
QYESALRGTPGVDDLEVAAQGQVVGSTGQTAPVPGDDLVTNIDSGLEQNLQQDLDSEIAQLHSSSGAAVALDPQTGAVLALVSYPTYNPTWWTPNGISTSDYQQIEADGALNDWAIDGLYTPGSTFKLATATAALQDGLISPSYHFYDPGVYTLGNQTFHDALGEDPGSIDVQTAITVSSDDFFYNLGVQFWDQRDKYGEDAIQNAANSLGYGEITGIDLPGETPDARVDSPQVVAKEHAQDPTVYKDGSWYAGSNLEMAFGQGGTVITPIEQAVAYSTFANGGTRYQPEVAAGFVNPVICKVTERIAPKVTGHVAYSSSNYQAMLNGFEGVVNDPSGTGYSAFTGFPLSRFPMAGKTGTASVAGEQPNSWFVGFGPVPNSQYVIAAVIQGGGYGEAAAAPVVANAFKYLVSNPAPAESLTAPRGSCSSSSSRPSGSSTPASNPASTSTSAPGTSSTPNSATRVAGTVTTKGGTREGSKALAGKDVTGAGATAKGSDGLPRASARAP